MTHEFPNDHDNPKDSQLIICLTGTPAYIREVLNNLSLDRNKPRQGTYIESEGTTSITTPVWKGEKY